jgi:hypothetical protein
MYIIIIQVRTLSGFEIWCNLCIYTLKLSSNIMLIFHGLILGAIPSQKCHTSMSLIHGGYRAMDVFCCRFGVHA